MLLTIFTSDLLPIFLIAAVGFLLARGLNVNVKTITHVVFYALIPCLVFNLLIHSKVSGPQVGRVVLLALTVCATMALIGYVAAKLLHLDRAELSAFLLVVMISNGGNYGLPVVLFAFGKDALEYATVFFITSSLLTNTVGVFVAAAGRKPFRSALAGVTKAPVVYAVLLAGLIGSLGLSLPDGVARPIGLLSDAALPMMILVLGMQLDRVLVPKRLAPVMAAVGISLVATPLIALALASMLGIEGAARQAGVLLASMPVAVVTTILAVEFDIAPAFVTATVYASTILSPLTLTLLIAFLQRTS